MNDAHQLAHLSGLDRRLVPAHRPRSEVTSPKIALQSIRFITPMLHWSTLQIASTALRSWRGVRLLTVMKRESSSWRVASLRVMGLVRKSSFKTAYRPFTSFAVVPS